MMNALTFHLETSLEILEFDHHWEKALPLKNNESTDPNLTLKNSTKFAKIASKHSILVTLGVIFMYSFP